MVFRKHIPRSCTYCAHGTKLSDDTVLCARKGAVSDLSGCWRFRYDPVKRVPPHKKPLDFAKYDDEDYSL